MRRPSTGAAAAEGAISEMINITTTAAQKVKGILEQEKESIPAGGLRIYVQGGGCSGFSYGMVLDEALRCGIEE